MTGGAAGPFAGKVVVVTGATRGLGREICNGFAAAGASVAVSSRKADACEQVAADLAGTYGVATLPRACHVGHWDELPGLVDDVLARFGRVDVLVNNAGMSPVYRSLSDVSEELFDKIVAVNLKGPFRLSALVADSMLRTGGGAIVNIGSAAADLPTADEVPYAAAKAGLQSMTAGMARAYGPSVRVNCVVAGPFLTDVSEHWDKAAFQEKSERDFALRRGGQPHEIVGAVLYLAGASAGFTTGAMLHVDGGYR